MGIRIISHTYNIKGKGKESPEKYLAVMVVGRVEVLVMVVVVVVTAVTVLIWG